MFEHEETKLLSWGIVDSAFDESEVFDLIYPLLNEAIGNGLNNFNSVEEVVEELLRRNLLFSFLREDSRRYRSRMAETVRLMNRLRQLFPKHEGTSKWRHASTLVADFRFIRRSRHYPRRDKTSDELLHIVLSQASTVSQQTVIERLLKRGEDFLYSGFQCRASADILEALTQGKSHGSIVCAGTGSGKTLAFYIPALYQVAARLLKDGPSSQWVKAIAIYPRNELLKDQFSEVYSEVRRLDDLLTAQGSRKIRIGAYFGPTPWSADNITVESNGWKQVAHGYACTYLRCPDPDCGGNLVWRNEHRTQGLERLTCDRGNHVVLEDEIALTRKTIQDNPPDILFTTTEMLNRRMSDSFSKHIFGLGNRAKQGPDIVLLDEVHTYAGTHGAQVAYLLRRWRYLLRKNIVFVGLSATLREAKSFFADITGLRVNQVSEITPHPEELDAEGAEYLLALRGDPVSKTSLLSTTIQASMLISRCLEPRRLSTNGGIYGSKLFVFTDDIDVTNRLYFDMLDAEGRDSWGNPDLRYHSKGGLAYLRESSPNIIRYEYGQDWHMCESIGHDLRTRMQVGRTSSQDSGVDMVADIVVATASLDVGFNDPAVGAILQHKAPKEAAQFLQRKGRAGRTRIMRPWTIVVLSDYGRDRLAYQGYDQLFDPELNPRHLPIHNRYVQRMQSVYALINYLSSLPALQNPGGHVWRELSRKATKETEKYRHQLLAGAILSIIQSEQAFNDFTQYLKNAMDIDDDTLISLLWEYPRPLMTSVMATTLRRLKSNWSKDGEVGMDYQISDNPLPEFVPSSLFSDLNLPEVCIRVPSQTRGTEPQDYMMPISQAMREFAPGRVSRRFGITHGGVRHWLVPHALTTDLSQSIEIANIGEYYRIGFYNYIDNQIIRSIPVYRPVLFRPSVPEMEISDTSYAKLIWKTEVVPAEQAIQIVTPHGSGWENIIKETCFYLHNHHNELEVRRFAISSEANIVMKGDDNPERQFSFTDQGEPVALGFTLLVDGLVVKVSVPDDLWSDTNGHLSAKWRSLRTQRYMETIIADDLVVRISNVFVREWLARIFYSAVICTASEAQMCLMDAAVAVRDNESSLQMENVLENLFQSSFVSDGEASSDRGEEKLRQSLREYMADEAIRQDLYDAARYLWEPIDDVWQSWLSQKYVATIAAALRQAMESLCPDLDMDSITIDLEQYNANADSATDEIWITETSVGGIGVIEELSERISKDPRNFFNIVQSSLMPSDFEEVDAQLVRFINLSLDNNTEVPDILDRLRNASNFKSAELEFAILRNLLSKNGFVLFHAFMSALNNRILKPGSSRGSDAFIQMAIKRWSDIEKTLQIEIDVKVFSYILSTDQDTDMADLVDPQVYEDMRGNRTAWRYNLIYGLLWPRGATLRQEALPIYSIYSAIPATDRLLVKDTLHRNVQELSIVDPSCEELCLDCLALHGIVRVICGVGTGDLLVLKKLFNFLMTNPVETDYMLLYPRIREVRKTIEAIVIEIELIEAVQ